MHTSGQCSNRVDNLRRLIRDLDRDTQSKLEDICDALQEIYDTLYYYYYYPSAAQELEGGDAKPIPISGGENDGGGETDGGDETDSE